MPACRSESRDNWEGLRARTGYPPAKPACGDAEATATFAPRRRELGAATEGWPRGDRCGAVEACRSREPRLTRGPKGPEAAICRRSRRCGDAEATATFAPRRRELGAAKTQRSHLCAYEGQLECQPAEAGSRELGAATEGWPVRMSGAHERQQR